MTIEKIAFGRTGHQSTRLLFGAAALGRVDQSTADRTLEVLLQHGINHIDTAASYGDAELRIAPWLKRDRARFFVATKTGARRATEAREELHRSLDRMGVDHVDLWQLHSLADPIDWDTALSPGGAIEAAVQAREEGLVRFIGVTGHGSQIAANRRRSLERFDFDTVSSLFRAREASIVNRAPTGQPPPAGSATWRCRTSNRSRCGPGATARTRTRPGTSHCRIRPASTGRSGGCWDGRACF